MDFDSISDIVSGNGPAELARQMYDGDSPELQRRRGIVGLSLLGMAAMGAVSLLQTGAVKHLPDPPIGPFDSDAANLSEDAFQFGIPDGTPSLASLAANAPLAALGGEERSRTGGRFHVGEIVFSSVAAAGWVLLVGIRRKTVAVFQSVFALAVAFHHANLRLPYDFERRLAQLVVTPRMHGVHPGD